MSIASNNFFKHHSTYHNMLYIKDGFPQINENVLCVVSKIYGNTVFVKIPEYEKDGVLTISEIAPGRIRNLRDHVVEEKRIICKVLRVDEKQNRIDVSLRRVNLQARKVKNEELKKEEFANRVYEEVAVKLQTTKDELFEKTYEYIFEHYDLVFEALYEIMLDNSKIKNLPNLNADEQEEFVTVINDKIKPEEETLKKSFELSSIEQDGVIKVKDVLQKAEAAANYSKMKIYYVGAGDFEVIITHEDMRSADRVFKVFKEELENQVKSTQCQLKIYI